MDIDPSLSISSARHSPYTVVLPNESVFDLEAYAQLYNSRPRDKINRLLFIANSSPSLALHAYSLALQTLKADTFDTFTYRQALKDATVFAEKVRRGDINDPIGKAWLDRGNAIEREDLEWVKETDSKARSGLDKLEVELKTYQNNLIKESIRMGHRDLAIFQHKCGNSTDAIRSWTKSREFCTTGQHLLEMCLGIIEISLETGNYSFVKNYVSKAEAALDSVFPTEKQGGGGTGSTVPSKRPAASGAAASSSAATGGSSGGGGPSEAQQRRRAELQERLSVANAIADLASGNFTKAAREFVKVKSPDLKSVVVQTSEGQVGTMNISSPTSGGGASTTSAVGGNGGGGGGGNGGAVVDDLSLSSIGGGAADDLFVPPADIGLYSTVCGLATFSRNQIRDELIENGDLRGILDSEQGLRELVREIGIGTKYGDGLKAIGISGPISSSSSSSSSSSTEWSSSSLVYLKPRLELDIHLGGSSKLESLRSQIRDRLVVRYFEPFEKVSLKRMGDKFGWSDDVMERSVVDLIKRGYLQGRVDRRERVLISHRPHPRTLAYRHAIEVGNETEKSTKALMLRMKLIESELFVGSGGGGGGGGGGNQKGKGSTKTLEDDSNRG